MAINLATKYSKQIDEVYTHESFVAGKANGKYEFTGVKGVKIYAPVTVPVVDYTRSGTARYGAPTEMQDEVQELVVSQDKAFALTIDKGNASEQMGTKNAGARLRQQMREQVIPVQDKYAISKYIEQAGKVAGVAAAPTKTTVIGMLSDAGVAMDNALVPTDGRYCFMGATYVGVLRQADAIVALEGLGTKALGKGVVGECMGFKIVRIPDSYLPAGCYFLCFRAESVVNPHKIHDTKLHQDPPGISGSLMEGRFLYDAFVLGKKADGVYACVATGSKQATPTISVSSGTATITSASATKILVTTDGSDPRYSDTAVTVSSGGTLTVGSTYNLKAVAYGAFTSDVAAKSA